MANLSNINNKFLVTTGGNVLIGQTAAVGSSILQVTGSVNITGGTTSGLNITTSGTQDTININRAANNDNAITKYQTASADKWIVGLRNTGDDKFRFYSYGTSTDVLTIDQGNGNVGIGTSTPNTALQVNQSTTVPLLVHRPSNTNFDPHGIGFSTRSDAINGGLGDVRSGIFSDYNGDLFLAAATSSITTSPLTYSRLFIEGGNGNVGIGTISPDFALDIEAVSTGVQLQMGRTTTNVGSTWMGSDSNGFHLGVGAYGSGNSVSDPNGFTVLTSGNVGIGTASPTYNLVVSNGGASGVEFAIATAAGLNEMLSYNRSTSVFEKFRAQAKQFEWYTDATANALVIQSGGNVGIGTDDPSEKLTLQLNTQNQAFSGKNGTDYLWFLRNEAGAGVRQSCRFQLMDTNVTTVNIESASNRNTYFNAGNVGIGTTTPNFKLGLSNSTALTAVYQQFTNGTTGLTSSDGTVMGIDSDGDFLINNQEAKEIKLYTSDTERMRIYLDGDITMGQFVNQQAPSNGILKIRTSGSTANVCYPLLYVGGSTHLATRQYGIGMDPEGYADRMKMFFGVDGMGNGYSYGDFVWNINATANNDFATPADERMRLDKGGDLKLKTGNLVVSDTSKGIVLGGTSTANQLRIYQHDTWAPSIYYQNATDRANATNSTQVGLYTRIGNMCMVQFRLVWNQASGTPAVDNIGIQNLPFGGSTTNTYAEVPCFIKNYTGGPSPRGNLTLTLPGANSVIALFNDTNNIGNMGNAIGSGTKEIRFSFTYTTNG